MVRIFTRNDGYEKLLTIIRHVLATGTYPLGLIPIGESELADPGRTLGGVTRAIEEVLDDYETTRPQTVLTDEARAKATD